MRWVGGGAAVVVTGQPVPASEPSPRRDVYCIQYEMNTPYVASCPALYGLAVIFTTVVRLPVPVPSPGREVGMAGQVLVGPSVGRVRW